MEELDRLASEGVATLRQALMPLVERYEAKSRRLGLDCVPALVEGELHPALHLLGQRVQRRLLQSHPGYAAMIHNLDANVGRLLAALDESGQADNTLVVFLSDNGGLSVGVEGSVTCTLPYREGKGWSEEGGLRIPLLLRWPARLPGGRVLATPMWQCDLYPTFLEAAGLPPEPERHLDGVSMLSMLAGAAAPDRPEMCWHYPHYSNQGGGPTGAIRHGQWKLIEHYETGQRQLFDLANDVAETLDLATTQPDLTANLAQRLAAWRREVGAQMPTPNPFYADVVAGRRPRPDGNGNYGPTDA
jgi:arylsulfatase A-like enzyme